MADVMFAVSVLAWILAIIGAVAGGVFAGWWVFHNAPPAGGEWWPYVRAVATIVAVILGAKVGWLIGMLGSLAVAAIGVAIGCAVRGW